MAYTYTWICTRFNCIPYEYNTFLSSTLVVVSDMFLLSTSHHSQLSLLLSRIQMNICLFSSCINSVYVLVCQLLMLCLLPLFYFVLCVFFFSIRSSFLLLKLKWNCQLTEQNEKLKVSLLFMDISSIKCKT